MAAAIHSQKKYQLFRSARRWRFKNLENNLSQVQHSEDSLVPAVILFLAIWTSVLLPFDSSCLYMSSFSLILISTEGSTAIGYNVAVSLPNEFLCK